MRKFMTAGTTLALSFAFAATAQADTVTTTFDGPEKLADGSFGLPWAAGPLNNQYGWKVAPQYDVAVAPVEGGQALRVSNAVTANSFGDMLHSKPVLKPAGENEATNVLVNEFKFTAPNAYVPGLFVTVSPDDGQGGRMSRLRFDDTDTGVKVSFADASFEDQYFTTLTRGETHSIKFESTFVKGDDNDVVRIFIDGQQMMRGGSWENYYRANQDDGGEERNPGAVDRLIIRTSGNVPAPASSGKGFLFDDVTSTSSHVNNPAPLNPPAPGPAGQNGTGRNERHERHERCQRQGWRHDDHPRGQGCPVPGCVSSAPATSRAWSSSASVPRCAVSACRLTVGRSRSISVARRLATTTWSWLRSTRPRAPARFTLSAAFGP